MHLNFYDYNGHHELVSLQVKCLWTLLPSIQSLDCQFIIVSASAKPEEICS